MLLTGWASRAYWDGVCFHARPSGSSGEKEAELPSFLEWLFWEDAFLQGLGSFGTWQPRERWSSSIPISRLTGKISQSVRMTVVKFTLLFSPPTFLCSTAKALRPRRAAQSSPAVRSMEQEACSISVAKTECIKVTNNCWKDRGDRVPRGV